MPSEIFTLGWNWYRELESMVLIYVSVQPNDAGKQGHTIEIHPSLLQFLSRVVISRNCCQLVKQSNFVIIV